ncbi:MAG: FAD-dependent oxidoreductase [Candidatus Levybacteria bacterium]|nr:FAD-dependent oxidoreductase [Candidatus Levybacteria bacterium]
MRLTLVDKKRLTSNIKSFVFLPHKNEDLRGEMRFFTISSSPFEKRIAITTRIFKKKSSFKKALDNLKIGEKIQAKGPDGDFVIEDFKKHHVFIAGGIGITPFIAIIRQKDYEKKPINVNLLYANKTKRTAFKKDLDEIASRHKEFKLSYIFSPKKIEKNVLSKFFKNKKIIFFVSGPDPMVDNITKILLEEGVLEENIKQDYFSGYKKI